MVTATAPWSRSLAVQVRGDDVVSHVGCVLPRMLADNTGLTTQPSRALTREGVIHDRGGLLRRCRGRHHRRRTASATPGLCVTRRGCSGRSLQATRAATPPPITSRSSTPRSPIPYRFRRHLLVTIDGAGSSHDVLDHLTTLNQRRGRTVKYSVGFDTNCSTPLPASCNTPAKPSSAYTKPGPGQHNWKQRSTASEPSPDPTRTDPRKERPNTHPDRGNRAHAVTRSVHRPPTTRTSGPHHPRHRNPRPHEKSRLSVVKCNMSDHIGTGTGVTEAGLAGRAGRSLERNRLSMATVRRPRPKLMTIMITAITMSDGM